MRDVVQVIIDGFMGNDPVPLNPGEVHCDWCHGHGWVMAHAGDIRCGKCKGNGKLKC